MIIRGLVTHGYVGFRRFTTTTNSVLESNYEFIMNVLVTEMQIHAINFLS